MSSLHLVCQYSRPSAPLHTAGARVHSDLLSFLVCADLQTALQTRLTIDWRAGVAATDWDTIAKKEHLDQLSVEMRKVEGQIREIYAEMLQLQQREQEMRDLNGEFGALPPRVANGLLAQRCVQLAVSCSRAAAGLKALRALTLSLARTQWLHGFRLCMRGTGCCSPA